jgi:hypothetical protein
MSTLPPEGPQAELQNLRQRVHELSQAVSSNVTKLEKKRTSFFVAGAVVAVVMLTSLSFLTSMAFRLDAQALTEIGRHEVQKNLPGSRVAMRNYLVDKAPEITAQSIEAMTGAVPHLRPMVVRELDARLRVMTAEFEEKIVGAMESSVRASKQDLDENFPDMGDSEKFNLLVSAVAKQYNANTQALLRELYPQYSAEMRRVNGYLASLRDKDPSLLTPREKMEREVIETLLRLIAREQAEYPDALTR